MKFVINNNNYIIDNVEKRPHRVRAIVLYSTLAKNNVMLQLIAK